MNLHMLTQNMNGFLPFSSQACNNNDICKDPQDYYRKNHKQTKSSANISTSNSIDKLEFMKCL